MDGAWEESNGVLKMIDTLSSDIDKARNSWEKQVLSLQWMTYPITDPWDWYIYLLIYHENQQNVGKYTIHGWYGYCWWFKNVAKHLTLEETTKQNSG